MTDEKHNIPIDNNGDEDFVDNFIEDTAAPETPVDMQNVSAAVEEIKKQEAKKQDDRMGERLERLGGEPAPVITPEEFARLQKSGQVNIDARGRVRTARRDDAEAGVSLRKRRAWYDTH